MSKTKSQIRKHIENLIADLELEEFKKDLCNELDFNYRLHSFENENYTQLGNTRLGGLPDLPKTITYPHNEQGYYNLLCQINFAELEDTLPTQGILYIFQGDIYEQDYKVIFTKITDNLEKKLPPKNLKNLNTVTKTPYEGIKANFQLEHYFAGETLWKVYRYDEEKFKLLNRGTSKYQSHILGNSMEDTCMIYKHLNGFDTLLYDTLLYKEIRPDYTSQLNSYLKECEEALEKEGTDKAHFQRRKQQLLQLDKEKERHFANYQKVTCLIGLESLDRLNWCWNDAGFNYLYILDEDLAKENFDNTLVQIWSS